LDCDLLQSEIQKISDLTTDVIAGRHGEYDFGSYKRGYFLLKKDLQNYDELIFCNDSCYGPVNGLQRSFNEMSNKSIDFWGITSNNYGYRRSLLFKNRYVISKKEFHLQSYFIVFRNCCFISNIFKEFMKAIKHEEAKNDIIINYEIGLTKLLLKSCFSCESYNNLGKFVRNVTETKWKELLLDKYPSPFLKVGLIRDKSDKDFVKGWDEFLIEHTNYPVELINSHLKRIKN